MADQNPPDEAKNMNGLMADSNIVHALPTEPGDKEELEMSNMPDDTTLDFEANNILLPLEISNDIESEVKLRRISRLSKGRISTAEDAIQGLTDVYYDDEDWVKNLEKDEDGEEKQKKRTRNVMVLSVLAIQYTVKNILRTANVLTRGHLIAIIWLVAYTAYFITAIQYEFGEEPSVRLLVCTFIGVIVYLRHVIYRAAMLVFCKINGGPKLAPKTKSLIAKIAFISRWLLYVGLAVVVVYVLVDEGRKSPRNLRSVPGLAAMLLVCLLFSSSPSDVNWHTIYWSVGLQFLCALLALKWDAGKDAILWFQDRLDEFFANSLEGSKFVFGEKYTEHYVAFAAMPIIFFSNATLVLLYYVGAMQLVIRVTGTMLSFILDTTPVESMSAAASIFMEGIVSVLTLRPYLGSLTRSQLFLVVTATMSSLGGAYMAILASLGVSLNHVITAMVVSAPATFAVCKLMFPENKKLTSLRKFDWDLVGASEKEKYSSLMDAFQDGAMSMLSLVGCVVSVSFVFVAYISWINKTLTWFGDRVGIDDLNIELVFSYLLFPVSLAMGIEWDDCRRVAMLLGYRIGSNNIVAFMKLIELKMQRGQYMQYMLTTNFTGPVSTYRDDITLELWNTTLKNGYISERSEVIVTYSLCGFSSLLTCSVITGLMYTLLPRRRAWLGKISMAALVAGNIANCMTGCFASLFY